MKLTVTNHVPASIPTTALALRSRWQKRPLPMLIFLALCFNLILAPAVFAAGDGALSRPNAYAVGVLLMVTVALAIYLFVVMLQPQRF